MQFNYQSYNQLLQYHDELEVINKYLPGVSIGKFFRTPFRRDPKPSAIIYIDKKGRLRFNDFKVNVNVIGLVALLYNESYRQAEERILRDFLGTFRSKGRTYVPNTKIYEKMASIPTIIRPVYREWKPYDEIYWNIHGGITKRWLFHPKVQVYPISKVHISSKKGDFTIKCDKLAYAFVYHELDGIVRYKIYQPLNKTSKWISNISNDIGGVVQLYQTLPKSNNNELAICASSLKDGGVIQCNTMNTIGWIPSFAPNNEGSPLPKQIIPKLNQRFKKILTWFDQDQAGHDTAKKYKQLYSWDSIFIPEQCNKKDPYEFRKKFGHYETVKLMQYLTHEK